MLELIRNALRITTTSFDDEISLQLTACQHELELAGVTVIDEDDELYQHAAILYAKAYFGFNGDSERYAQAFGSLRDAMALSGDYGYIHEDED